MVPDIAVFLWDKLPLDENEEILDRVTQAPDWAVKILSSEQAATRPMDNLLFLLQYGMALGWLVDPYEKVVFAFQPNCAPMTLRGPDRLPLLQSLSQNQLTAQELFDFLRFANRLSTI